VNEGVLQCHLGQAVMYGQDHNMRTVSAEHAGWPRERPGTVKEFGTRKLFAKKYSEYNSYVLERLPRVLDYVHIDL
jgi:hypothetical protein